MTRDQNYFALQRAIMYNPLWLPAYIYQVQKDINGTVLMQPNGNFAIHITGQAYVTFDFGTTDQVPAFTGGYEGDYKILVFPQPITQMPLVLPDLNETFALRLKLPDFDQHLPEWSIAANRIGGDSMALTVKFAAKRATPDELNQFF